MNEVKRYFQYIENILEEIEKTQAAAMEKAAEMMAQCVKQGGKIYAFGSGHSHIMAEEIYVRAGGLACVRAILPPELMVHELAEKSTFIERLSGYSKGLINLYQVDEQDAILIVSNSGRNPVPVEMALEAKKRGAKVIVLTSLAHSSACTSRHESGKRLFECADVVIDNLAPKGDAAFKVDGVSTPMGPVSDAAGVVIVNALMAQTAACLAGLGVQPEVFVSSNVDGGDEINDSLFRKNYGYWK